MSSDIPSDGGADPPEGETTAPHLEDLFEDLSDLTEDVQSPSTSSEVTDIKHLLAEAHQRGLIESGVRRFQASDVAEAFVGSVIFASPLLIEDGVFDIATHLFQFSVYGIPIFLIANTAFVVFMTYALLEWTGRNKDESNPLFGVVPVRLIMILVVSFLVAALLMTVWGRVGDWQPPAEAIARINVIWTVGSLGAALGDIVSNNDTSPTATEFIDEREAQTPERQDESSAGEFLAAGPVSDGELVEAIHEQFDELASTVESTEERREVQRIREKAVQATIDDLFGARIRKYTTRDIAEAFVGSVFFSIPFLVEDGVYDVADYFLSFRVGYFPVFFLVNAVFVVSMIAALVYWAGPQNVRTSRPIFGIIPRRLLGISVVSYLTAAILMTMWGRVGDWHDPVVAIARVSVVWTAASFGAALGDILPGESSGADINDELSALAELTIDEGESLLNRNR